MTGSYYEVDLIITRVVIPLMTKPLLLGKGRIGGLVHAGAEPPEELTFRGQRRNFVPVQQVLMAGIIYCVRSRDTCTLRLLGFSQAQHSLGI